ncbi:hypothetical protein ABIB75_001064 [Bradyrhizobium sp. GM2.2]|uniref:hypothetical protein n=1 Tax=Bradyrhizobium sp. GM2.2 TaxID=3156358 RepID=UPI0033929B43
MQQLQMFDPRSAPTATAEMLADTGLRAVIATMRRRGRVARREWPYVEAVGEIGDNKAWAVDDGGERFVVVGDMVYEPADLAIMNVTLRTAATAAFGRLDQGVAA